MDRDRRSPRKEKGPVHMTPAPKSVHLKKVLEVDLHSELELSRIKRRRRTAVITTVGGTLVKRVDVVKEGRRRTFIEPIEEVEALGNQIQPDAFAQSDDAASPQVPRHELVRDAHVATKVARREDAVSDQ